MGEKNTGRVIKFRAAFKLTGKVYDVTEILWSEQKVCLVNERGDYRLESLDDVVLLQFTGLHDKNGKEIYEGDLMHCHYAKDGCKEQPMEVIYSTEAAAFLFKRRGICQQVAVVQRPSDHSGWRGEVIGSVYENPELLK